MLIFIIPFIILIISIIPFIWRSKFNSDIRFTSSLFIGLSSFTIFIVVLALLITVGKDSEFIEKYNYMKLLRSEESYSIVEKGVQMKEVIECNYKIVISRKGIKNPWVGILYNKEIANLPLLK